MADGILKDVAGAVMGWFSRRRDGAKEAARVSQERHAVAAILGGELDRFAADCLAVAYDDGTAEGRPAGKDGIYHEATVSRPTFDPAASQVDLKALPAELMYAILDLPTPAAEVNASLADEGFYDPPDHPQFFRARQSGYAELGHRAAQLARRLRQLVGVPEPALPSGEQSREMLLRERLEQLEDEEIARNKRWDVAMASSRRDGQDD